MQLRHRYHSGTFASSSHLNNLHLYTTTTNYTPIPVVDQHDDPTPNHNEEEDDTTTTTTNGKRHGYRWIWYQIYQTSYRWYHSTKRMTTTTTTTTPVRSKSHRINNNNNNNTACRHRLWWFQSPSVLLRMMISIVLFSIGIIITIIHWNESSMGIYVDDYLRQRYLQQIQQQRQQRHTFSKQQQHHHHHSLYPDVTIKATRKIERAHYSYYLYEILQHYYNHDITGSTSTHRNTPEVQYAGNRRKQNTKSTPPPPLQYTSSSFSVVQIHGLPDRIVDAIQDDHHSHNENRHWYDWWCDRCVRTAYRGSYQNCTDLCSLQYLQQVYFPTNALVSLLPVMHHHNRPTEPLLSPVTVSYHTIPPMEHHHHHQMSKRSIIPHIIHQAWDDPITTMEYPELARIQNTYRALSGYEYHFYTYTLQIQFIQQHYPKGVLSIYETMKDVDQRYRLFQLLVLYQWGGIYVNVDVVLEVHFDALLEVENDDTTPSLIVVRHPNIIQPHCTYNVLIAAAPGHPIIQAMMEASLQLFLRHATSSSAPINIWSTYFHTISTPDDISTFPIWKLHTAASTTTSSSESDYSNGGNCVWGLYINRALQQHPVADLNVWGYMNPLLVPLEDGKNQTIPYGRIMILMASHDDTGATRITDMNRNLLIASTNVVGVSHRKIATRRAAQDQ